MNKLEFAMWMCLTLIWTITTVFMFNKKYDEKQKKDNDNALIETTLQIQQLKLMKIL